jgi:DNA-binding MarR family transcriptional regulator/DNA-binding CsgD family transcriptional regulator
MKTHDHLKSTLLLEEDVEEGAPLSDRLLFYLLKHPLQRSTDLAWAMSAYASTATVQRHLTMLEAQGFVEHVRASLYEARPHFYYLTTQGIEHLARLIGAVPEKLARMWSVNEAHLLRLLPYLSTIATLNDFLKSLLVHAPRMLAYPGGHPATIRWHWVLDYRHAFRAKKRRQHVIGANASLVFTRSLRAEGMTRDSEGEEEQEGEYYQLLLFVDPGLVGNHDLRIIHQRLERVLLFRESAQRWSHYQAFPPVLILTPTPHSRELWMRCARESAARLHIAPLQGAIAVQEQATSAWTLAWYSLTTAGPCHVQDLISPQARAAVLPGLLAPKPTPAGTFQSTQGQQRQRILVKGSFQERAARLAAPISQLSPQDVCLLSLKLQPRHQEVLRLLYAHPLLAREEIAILLNMEPETIRRYLYDLVHLRCIEKLASPGHRYHLSSTGLRFMAQSLQVSLLHVSEMGQKQLVQRSLPHALRSLRHTTGVYAFIARLTAAARHKGHEITWWETGARCARRYHFQGAWHNLFPDALLEYRAEGLAFRAWVEWDEGTMRLRHLTAKFHAYVQFVRARQFMSMEGGQLPLLLIITPEPSQEQRVQRIAADIFAHSSLVVQTTTQALLTVRGPLAPIWWPITQPDEEKDKHAVLRQALLDVLQGDNS